MRVQRGGQIRQARLAPLDLAGERRACDARRYAWLPRSDGSFIQMSLTGQPSENRGGSERSH